MLVAFEGGDSQHPFVLGGLWNGVDAPPPIELDGGELKVRRLVSRDGNEVYLRDKRGDSSLGLRTGEDEVTFHLSAATGDEGHLGGEDRALRATATSRSRRAAGSRSAATEASRSARAPRRSSRARAASRSARAAWPRSAAARSSWARARRDEPMVNDEFIGAGWAFPLRTDATGRIALVTPRARDRGEHPPHPRHGLRRAADAARSSAAASTTRSSPAPTRRPSAASPPTCAPRCVAGSPGSPSRTSRSRPTPRTPATLYIDIRYTSGRRTTRATSSSPST